MEIWNKKRWEEYNSNNLIKNISEISEKLKEDSRKDWRTLKMKYHVSVLLQEAIEALNIKNNEKYIDATLGGGGHAEEIVKHGGISLGIDVDMIQLNMLRRISKLRITNNEIKNSERELFGTLTK